MDVVLTVLGIGLIAVAVRDVFETLFHPSGRGVLGRWIVRAVWSVTRRLRPRGGSTPMLVGPLGLIAVLVAWTGMLAVGWALILLPHLPDGFTFNPGLSPSDHESFGDALYISLVNLTSLGYGDISPTALGLRILGPVETLFGLGLLTVSISWLVSIYGALLRRDSFAHEVHLTREAEKRLGEKLADADPELLERMLASFTEQLIATRRDVIHFPITYYFRSEDAQLVLSTLVPFLRRLIAEASEEGRPHALKVRAEMLGMALDDYDGTLRSRLKLGVETP
jgi:hypothetical protein